MTGAAAPPSISDGLFAIVIDAQGKILARTAATVAGFSGRDLEPGRFLDEADTLFGEAFYECVNTASRTGERQFERKLESDDGHVVDLWFQPCSAGQPAADGAVVVITDEAPDGNGQSERHNLQNILAQVRGLVTLGQKEAGSLAHFAGLLCDRVDVLIAVDALYAGSDTAPLRTVIERAASVVGLSGIALDGADFATARALALPLALILHEWSSPLARHAHPTQVGPDQSPIAVAWRMEGADLLIDWSETGANEYAGRASALADRMVEATVYRAGGIVHERETRDGMRRTIRLPVA